MTKRREFIKTTTAAAAALFTGAASAQASGFVTGIPALTDHEILMSTWNFGLKSNEAGLEILRKGGTALDAVEHGIRRIESDPDNTSVGIGGLPDRDGHVTLDACIMDESQQAGSVTFLKNILHPISVARLVMEKTPHVMLSGEGALRFAVDQGFAQENLLTEQSRQAWEEWKKESRYHPVINIENHDTIGMLAMDRDGRICGGCSTSGLAYKMHGRVGDSPIIGAGLFVDGEFGAAVTTGLGELVMKSLSSFLVVEMMRKGTDPIDACREAIERIVRKFREARKSQVAIIALRSDGATAAFAIQPGFSYALYKNEQNEVIQADCYLR